jgi:hypothetical protein
MPFRESGFFEVTGATLMLVGINRLAVYITNSFTTPAISRFSP